jgi:cutinase
MLTQAAIIFGDPNNGKAVGSVGAAKTKVFCNATDNICQGGATILAAHLVVSQLNQLC